MKGNAATSPTTLTSLIVDADYYDMLFGAIRAAKQRIWASQFSFNMQAIPDGKLQVRSIARTLADAAKRGIDVRILVGGNARRLLLQPAGNDLTLAFLHILGVDGRSYARKARAGSHAKYALFDDDLALVGSHNWSPRAFGDGIDSTLAVKSETVANKIAGVFDKAWKSAVQSDMPPELKNSLPQLETLLNKKTAMAEWVRKPAATQLKYSDGAVNVLVDRAYHVALLKALTEAEQSIDVSMFYFSYSTKRDHPNTAIVQELVRAKKRGVRVQVLLDRDRPGDLYNSRRINETARKYLAERGIAVAFDAPETVNHSKFVAIDGKRVLLGSHNWTRNSQEQLHEVSLSVENSVISKKCSELVSVHFE